MSWQLVAGLALLVVGLGVASAKLLGELGEAKAEMAVVSGALDTERAVTELLRSEAADRDAQDRRRARERAALAAQNAELNQRLREAVQNEPDEEIRRCARLRPPADVARLLREQAARGAAGILHPPGGG